MNTKSAIAIALLLGVSGLLAAQTISIDLSNRCLYSKVEFAESLYSFGENPRVTEMVDEICTVAGIEKNFQVISANVPTVAAVSNSSGRYLIYSLSYSRRMMQQDPKVLYALLAHEIGHLARDHRLDDSFRLYEESSADEFMGRVLFRLKAFRSVAEAIRSIQKEPFVYEQLYAPGQRIKTITNGWNSSEGLVKAQDNLGYLDNENTLNDLPLPLFKLQGCPRAYNFPKTVLSRCRQIKDVEAMIKGALGDLGYEQRSYYYAPNGFAMLTPIEQIRKDGTPLQGSERWQDYPAGGRFEGVLDYLSSLLVARPGYFRLFVFVVTDQHIANTGQKIGAEAARSWLQSGGHLLPESIGNLPVSSGHQASVFIYEFEAPESTKVLHQRCDVLLSVKEHLQKSGLDHKIGN